jgi:hypothetical protein
MHVALVAGARLLEMELEPRFAPAKLASHNRGGLQAVKPKVETVVRSETALAARTALGEAQLSLRDAAYMIAIDRVARACRERGWV